MPARQAARDALAMAAIEAIREQRSGELVPDAGIESAARRAEKVDHRIRKPAGIARGCFRRPERGVCRDEVSPLLDDERSPNGREQTAHVGVAPRENDG